MKRHEWRYARNAHTYTTITIHTTDRVYPMLVSTHRRTKGNRQTTHTNKATIDKPPQVTRRQGRPGVRHQQEQYHRPRLADACPHPPPKGRKVTTQASQADRDGAQRRTRRQERSRVHHHQANTIGIAYPTHVLWGVDATKRLSTQTCKQCKELSLIHI